jgi:hypothetical protein
MKEYIKKYPPHERVFARESARWFHRKGFVKELSKTATGQIQEYFEKATACDRSPVSILNLEESRRNLFLVIEVNLSKHKHRAGSRGFPFLMTNGFSHRIV